jgi:hypothetical protein
MKFDKLLPWLFLIAALYFLGPSLMAAFQRGSGAISTGGLSGGLGGGLSGGIGGAHGARGARHTESQDTRLERRAQQDEADEAAYWAAQDKINADWERWEDGQRAQGLKDSIDRLYESSSLHQEKGGR